MNAGIVPAGTDEPLMIDVVGRQYIWQYRYPGVASSYEEMVAPVGVTVKLKITSIDVARSWWIPKLGGKFDAIPGDTYETRFRLSEEGVYQGQCAELCGRNHASMLGRVRGVSAEAYAAWLARQKRENAEGRAAAKAGRPTVDRQESDVHRQGHYRPQHHRGAGLLRAGIGVLSLALVVLAAFLAT